MATVETPGGVKSSPSDNQEEQMVMSALLDSLARYQDVMKQLQSQAKQLMTVGSTLKPFFSINIMFFFYFILV